MTTRHPSNPSAGASPLAEPSAGNNPLCTEYRTLPDGTPCVITSNGIVLATCATMNAAQAISCALNFIQGTGSALTPHMLERERLLTANTEVCPFTA